MATKVSTKSSDKANLASKQNDFEVFLKYVKSMNKPECLEKIPEEEFLSIYERIKSKDYNVFDFFYVCNEGSDVITIIPAYSFFYKKISDKIEYLNFEYHADFFDIIVKRKEWASETRWRVFYAEHTWKKRVNSYWQNKFHFMVRRAGIIDMIKIVFADILENEIGIYYHDDSIYNLMNAEEVMNEGPQNGIKEAAMEQDANNQESHETSLIKENNKSNDFFDEQKESVVAKMILEAGEEIVKHFIDLYENFKDVAKDKKTFINDMEYLYNLRSWDGRSNKDILRALYAYTKSYYEQKRQKA